MWAMAVVILLVGVVCSGTAYSAYQDDEAENDTQDFYDGYDEDNGDSKDLTILNLLTRMKRFEDNVQIRTLDPKEIHDVQGALGKIFNGHLPESLTSRVIRQYTDIYDYIDSSKTTHDNTRRTDIPTADYEDQPKTFIKTSPDPVQEFSEEYFHYQPAADLERLRPAVDFHGWQSEMGGGQQWAPESDVRGIPTLAKLNYGPTFEDLEATTSDVQVVEVGDMVPIKDLQPDYPNSSTPSPEEQTVGSIEAQTWMPLEDTMPNSNLQETLTYSNDYMHAEVNKLMPDRVGTVEDFTSSEASRIDVIDVHKWSAYTETPYIEELSTYNPEEIRKDVQYIMYPYETTSAVPTWMEYPQRVQTWSPSDDANILRSTSHVPIQRNLQQLQV
ncbi:hypothetical protein B5X24_HaOG203862 [Helicoverpa armigera]|nr:hypothetical protein B5X24_HaOG203862 [Helicoverpa armigera]